MMEEHEKLELAKRRVRAMTGFYIHLAVFLAVLILLFVINVAASKVWWVHWVLLGWGVFVVAHAVTVFADLSGMIRRWQDRKARELADKM